MRRAIQVADPMSTPSTAVCGAVRLMFGPFQRPGGVRRFAGPDGVFEVNVRFSNDTLCAATSVPRRGLMA